MQAGVLPGDFPALGCRRVSHATGGVSLARKNPPRREAEAGWFGIESRASLLGHGFEILSMDGEDFDVQVATGQGQGAGFAFLAA